MQHLFVAPFFLVVVMSQSAVKLSVASEIGFPNPSDAFWQFPSCDLECTNGGYCTLIEGSTVDLAREAQAGKLIEICVCRPGFTGVSCEIAVEECEFPEHKCHNGVSCTAQDTLMKNGTTEISWVCDCSVADSLSEFAGRMCRDPITEYCTGAFDPHAARSFCTNGGRCLADFIGAKVDPGNTSANRAYQHEGCVCSNDFVGPHCEFLRTSDDNGVADLGGGDDQDTSLDLPTSLGRPESDLSASSDTKGVQSPGTIFFLGMICFVLLLTVAVAAHTRKNLWWQVDAPVEEIVLPERSGRMISTWNTANTSNYVYVDNRDNIAFRDEGIILPYEYDDFVNTPGSRQPERMT
jgi:hypothetical protein